MSKPDSYMPMEWPAFWQAVKGWPLAPIVAYQKALTHYWFHLHCEGLKNDSEFLRKVCETDKEDWPICLEHVFDNNMAFKLNEETGLWHQKRAREDWAKVNQRYSEIITASQRGVIARRKLGQLPPVKPSVHPSVRPVVKPLVKRAVEP